MKAQGCVFSDLNKMSITSTQIFIEATEMQEWSGTNIGDDIYQSSKDKLSTKVSRKSSTRQLNHTYLENMIAHDQTKQDNNT